MKLKDEVGIDGRAKKYMNKICRDNRIHCNYIPTLGFLDCLAPVDGDPWCYP